MNIDIYDLVKVLVGLIIALCTWIVLREISRINKQGERLEKLEADSIKRVELDEKLEKISEERLRLHEENKEKLDTILLITKSINTHDIDIARILLRISNLEEYQHYLGEWKHKVVDPLIHKTMEDHERRLVNIERRS